MCKFSLIISKHNSPNLITQKKGNTLPNKPTDTTVK